MSFIYISATNDLILYQDKNKTRPRSAEFNARKEEFIQGTELGGKLHEAQESKCQFTELSIY